MQTKICFKNIARALRLPFITASTLPFIFGSFIAKTDFNLTGFLLGFISVVTAHLSANLINDYCDSRSTADWQDKKFYAFFGGSKLIQENIFSEKFYFYFATVLALISFASCIILAVFLKSIFCVIIYLVILILSWQYTAKPFQFSYHYLGELFIFLLFGPALVMGGYFIQTGIFPDKLSFMLSLPFGFFTCAILFANEVPDYNDDLKAGKNTWVALLGQGKSFLFYRLLVILGLVSVLAAIYLKFIGIISLFSIFLIIPALKASNVLKNYYSDKEKLVSSSQITILMQTLLSVFLILGLLL